MLALSLAGFGAGRLDPCVNDFGVALGWNLFLRFDNRSADRAADAIRQTRFGTGCLFTCNSSRSMFCKITLFRASFVLAFMPMACFIL